MVGEGAIRVFLLDDHELVRRGVADVIDAESDMTVVGESATVRQAVPRIRATAPDVALLDVRLPDGSGVDVCRTLNSDGVGTRCIMLTAYDDEEALYAAVIAGAFGYVLKDVRGSGLLEAVRRVASGRSLLDASLKNTLANRIRSAPPGEDPRLDALSARERQVLALISEGLTNRQIGERLQLVEKTVKNHVSSILSKLGLQRRTQAAVLGRRGEL